MAQLHMLQLPQQGAGSPALRRPVSPGLTGRNGIVVFSGGSATNSLVDVFEGVREANQATLSYVIPISDNGGSTSEIIRVFGGPGIGDVRSRLVRLIPNDGNLETAAIKNLFNHRLPDVYPTARAEWFEILEGTHPLWINISSPKRELIRSFLNSFNLEVVKRMRPSSRFDFSGASIGNLFLTGARLFTGSFEAAIYLLSSVCTVPDRVSVLPALNTNFAHHIAAGLADGTVITGQNDISHPSIPSAAVPVPGINTGAHTPALSTGHGADGHDAEDHDHIEDANLPGSLPALRRPAITFSKEDEEDLPSRIDRIWYINPYGQKIRIPANPRVLESIGNSHTVIYSIGSLFTSLIPNLILKGVGEAIASPLMLNKILILNGTVDRETGPSDEPFTALDFEDYSQYVTHIVYLEGEKSPAIDRAAFIRLGIDTTRLYGPRDELGRGGRYDAKALVQRLESIIGRRDVKSERSRRYTLVG
ncbi:hypothetical protein PT974_08109 [Cladobotryum mycophilum]|uniref:Uncharacterized protein n=1 Tax=Cladobotryum mycophilum TaxID=491253 RepID=A0ABR0SCE5_9HYPO